MRRSTDRILTTHVGALPAPHDVWARSDVAEERLAEAVVEVCDAQRRAGIDFINEGELTKGGHWTEYLASRLGGYEPAGHPGALGELLLSSTDWVDFRLSVPREPGDPNWRPDDPNAEEAIAPRRAPSRGRSTRRK